MKPVSLNPDYRIDHDGTSHVVERWHHSNRGSSEGGRYIAEGYFETFESALTSVLDQTLGLDPEELSEAVQWVVAAAPSILRDLEQAGAE